MFNFFKKKSLGTVKTFKIGKMHCVSCGINIDGALEDMSGVYSASTSYKKAETVIDFDPKLVNEDKLKKIIKAEGYEVR